MPPIVPVVFYQGKRRWRHARDFVELFADDAVREWPWTPRFHHLLLDQSQAAVSEVRGEALGACRAACADGGSAAARESGAALLMATQTMGELARSGRIEPFGAIVKYVITTQDKETVREFGEALRRHVPGPGGDMKTYAEELLQEGLQRGRQEGQLGTIENFLRAGIEWSVIKEATGIDQEAFQALRRRLGESDRTTE